MNPCVVLGGGNDVPSYSPLIWELVLDGFETPDGASDFYFRYINTSNL